MTIQVIRGDARELPLADNSVDLICTSPPYFGLRSYQDGGAHYSGQVGSEATPAEFLDALTEVTREWMRVLKPTGSLWVNLGDKYSSTSAGSNWHTASLDGGRGRLPELHESQKAAPRLSPGAPTKSLIGIPWRYALRCIDDLGLILRAEVIWAKPNGLPESVTDRVRRSHEQWFHFTLQPRYFSAVDEIREAHIGPAVADPRGRNQRGFTGAPTNEGMAANPLGKLPGSVWTIPTEPLRVPEHLGVDHFAAFPSEWPKRIIQGWSPSGVCVECGEGRRPVTTGKAEPNERLATLTVGRSAGSGGTQQSTLGRTAADAGRTITAYACRCSEWLPWQEEVHAQHRREPVPGCVPCFPYDGLPPTTPAVVLDPFGGTGTTAHVASALGRHGISVDLSADYCRLASAPELVDARVRKVLGIDKAPAVMDGQGDLFGGDAA